MQPRHPCTQYAPQRGVPVYFFQYPKKRANFWMKHLFTLRTSSIGWTEIRNGHSSPGNLHLEQVMS
jgi:hypothetical protein